MNRCPATMEFPGYDGYPATKGRITCELEQGHVGYHWGGPNGVQPWPPVVVVVSRIHKIFMPSEAKPQLFPNDLIGIRPGGGYCPMRTRGFPECDLRFGHPGPCASKSGKVWDLTSVR